MSSKEPIFFKSPAEWRKWLQKNHQKETEVIVGFYKTHTGKAGLSWSQSVDEALCVGWIDGVRTSIDEDRYKIRFTPRKTTSIWSAVNIKKVEELTKKGLMKPAGLKAFSHRKEEKSKVYIHENEAVSLSKEYEKQFKANPKAWAFFQAQPPGYRKLCTGWVMKAKQEATRQKRLNGLIAASAQEKRL